MKFDASIDSFMDKLGDFEDRFVYIEQNYIRDAIVEIQDSNAEKITVIFGIYTRQTLRFKIRNHFNLYLKLLIKHLLKFQMLFIILVINLLMETIVLLKLLSPIRRLFIGSFTIRLYRKKNKSIIITGDLTSTQHAFRSKVLNELKHRKNN